MTPHQWDGSNLIFGGRAVASVNEGRLRWLSEVHQFGSDAEAIEYAEQRLSEACKPWCGGLIEVD